MITYESGSEAGFWGSDPGREKKQFFSEGDYHIEISSFSFQKYAQRVPLGKIIIFLKNIKKFYKKRKKLEHLKVENYFSSISKIFEIF